MSTESNKHPHKFSVNCWNCRKLKHLQSDEAPRFSFDVARIAKTARWKPVYDPRCGRILIFCSNGCIEACRLKSGHIRRFRPKQPIAPLPCEP